MLLDIHLRSTLVVGMQKKQQGERPQDTKESSPWLRELTAGLSHPPWLRKYYMFCPTRSHQLDIVPKWWGCSHSQSSVYLVKYFKQKAVDSISTAQDDIK